MQTPKKVTIFLASPGDLQRERDEVDKIVDLLNKTAGKQRHNPFYLRLKRWESDTYSSIGRAQKVIISQIGKYDIFIGIMWKRFGSPTGESSSGTKEEFDHAYSLYLNKTIRHIAFYFCEGDIPIPKSVDDCEQLREVVLFRQQLNNMMLVKSYKDLEEFSRVIYRDLYSIVDEVLASSYLKATQESQDKLDPKSLLNMAVVLSEKGNVEGSINILHQIADEQLDSLDNLEKAEVMRLTGVQYRHRAEFDKCAEYYARAEIYLANMEPKAPDAALFRFKLVGGKIMLDEYLFNGKCMNAHSRYKQLESEIDFYLRTASLNEDDKQKCKLIQQHSQRQRAEMLRISGKYQEALNMFTEAYENYSYASAAAKAHSALGQADCLRLLCSFHDAGLKYNEVEVYALERDDMRLLARVYRNQAFLVLENDNEMGYRLIERLLSLSSPEKTGYFYGRFYGHLIKGILKLEGNPSESITIFQELSRLAEVSYGGSPIEYAHSQFYIAEALRLLGDLASATSAYATALHFYESTKVNWGVVRSMIGLSLASKDHGAEITISDIALEGVDKDIHDLSRAGVLQAHFMLGYNLV